MGKNPEREREDRLERPLERVKTSRRKDRLLGVGQSEQRVAWRAAAIERECQLITLNEMVTLFNQALGHLGILWVDNANFVLIVKIDFEVR